MEFGSLGWYFMVLVGGIGFGVIVAAVWRWRMHFRDR